MAKNMNPGVLPTLYSKNEDGSVNKWTIKVDVRERPIGTSVGVIVTEYGRVGGATQTTEDVIAKGKNEGKANETTSVEQAKKEALAKWTKQKKKGYVETMAAALAGKVDAVIAGGIEPMLAHKYRDHSAKISYPAYVQPKLDGIRCIAILKDGKCTLWSRTRKPITGVPHIAIHLERLFAGKGDIVLDGELYNHKMKKDFEKIVSYVRQVKPAAGHEIVQYHVYDTVRPGTFEERNQALLSLLPQKHSSIVMVQTVKVANEEGMMEWFSDFMGEGYEGCMVRNAAGLYKNARSYDLQKVKEFEDAEFEIIGTEEGRGKMADKAIFVCKTKQGEEFRCKMEGDLNNLRQYLNNKKVIGKKLTVVFQGYTNGNVPRFPVGKAIRDYE